MKANKNFVVLAYGGAMAGVYAAGVLTSMERKNLFGKTSAIYGASAGIQAGAYYACGQVEEGSAIFWEYLNANKYVKWNYFNTYFLSILFGFTTRYKMCNSQFFNINTFVYAEENYKKLKLEKISILSTPVHAIVYNLIKQETELLKINSAGPEKMNILKASSGGQPAYPLVNIVNGVEYLDGDIFFDRSYIDYICNKYRDDTVLCIISDPQPMSNSFIGKFPLYIQYILNRILFGKLFARKAFLSKANGLDTSKYLIKYKNLKFLINPIRGQNTQSDAKKLKEIWANGVNEMDNYLKTIDI